MDSSSRVLIVGSTGYIGTWITKACLASPRHRTFLLTSPATHANIHKLQLLLSYKEAGATLVEASLDDSESLVSVLSGIDYVISAIAENQLEQQLKLVRAIKQVGTIKRFLPSEYELDPDFMEHSMAPGSVVFEQKRGVRRAIEESGIPHTYVVAHCFAGYYLSGLAEYGRFWTPPAKVSIYGDGNHKVVWNVEEDIGKYVVKAMDDERTLNRTIYIRPPSNIKSQMEAVNLWETLSGKTLQKEHVSEQQFLQTIQEHAMAAMNGANISSSATSAANTPTATTKYPYPSTLNVANFVSIKSKQDNYLLWRIQILGLIESQELHGFITGDVVMPEETVTIGGNTTPNPEHQLWRRSDRLLRGWITGTLTEEVLGIVVGQDTAEQVWKTLEEAYAMDSQERECCMLQKLQTLKKRNMSMNEYIRVFKATCDELMTIGKPVNEHTKVFMLLNGLGPGYEAFVTTMLRPPSPSYKELVPLLHSHEAFKIYNAAETDQPHMAFYSQLQQHHGQRGRRGGFSSQGRGFRPYSNRQGNPVVTTAQQAATEGMKKPENKDKGKICQICQKPNHTAVNCWYRYDGAKQVAANNQALAAMNIASNQEEAWFPDTGATAHITADTGQGDKESGN